MSAAVFGAGPLPVGPRTDAKVARLNEELEHQEKERDRLEDRIRYAEEDLYFVEQEIDSILKALDDLENAVDDSLTPPYGAPLVPSTDWWTSVVGSVA